MFSKQQYINGKIFESSDFDDFQKIINGHPIERAIWFENFRLGFSAKYIDFLDLLEEKTNDDKILDFYVDCLSYLIGMSLMIRLSEEEVSKKYVEGLRSSSHEVNYIIKLIFKLLVKLQDCRSWRWFSKQHTPLPTDCFNNLKNLWQAFGQLTKYNNLTIKKIINAFNQKHELNLVRVADGYFKKRFHGTD